MADGRTSADGVVEAALPDDASPGALGIVVCGDEVGIADPGSWVFSQRGRELAAFIYTDKPIYRPGHTAHVKAVLRWRHQDALAPFDQSEVEIAITDATDNVVARQRARVDEFGGAAIDVPLGPGAALGVYGITVSSGEAQATGSFEVQEYRRPEYEVIVTVANRFVVQGNEAVADVQARYYFGQPVANATVHYVVDKQPYFSPLRFSDDADPEEGGGWYGGDLRSEGDLTLGADGRGQIRIPLELDADGRDYRARIDARVADASGREVSGAGVVHATVGSFLVAARLDQYMARPGATVALGARTVDYQGVARADVPVRVLVERLDYATGYYNPPTVTRMSETTARTDGEGRLSTQVRVPDAPGSYRVAVVAQEGERQLRDDAWLWVPGPSQSAASGENDYLELLADKRTYAPGETARVVVRGRDVVGPVLLTKEGQHVSWHQVVRPTVAGAFEIPIADGDIGDVYVHVTLLRDGRLLQAERRLAVPPVSRTLQIAVTAERPVAKPQDPASFAVQVSDADGRPVRASVSLAVIDEAVFGVKADDTPDPARVFYRREYSRVGTAFSRDYHFTGFSGTDRLRLASRRRRPMSLADFKADRLAQPQVRKEFPDAIHWVASLVTDAEGRGRITVRYPDTLTTWRLTARAVTTDTKVGVALARTTTTKDLIVRLITPRFLTEGDAVATPTIVHNYVDEARETRVQVTAAGVTTTGATAAVSSAVAAGGERRDPWSYAAPAPGRAVFTATAATASDRDAVELTVPILPYGVRREVSATGSLTAGSETTQSLVVPAHGESLGPHRAGVAGAVDRRRAAGRGRPAHQLPVRLHRADAVELRAQPGGDARPHRAAARAERAAVGARPPGHRRPAPPLRPAARRRRLGLVARRRQPPLHDGLRAVGPGRRRSPRLPCGRRPARTRAAGAGDHGARLSARRARAEGLHDLGARRAPWASARTSRCTATARRAPGRAPPRSTTSGTRGRECPHTATPCSRSCSTPPATPAPPKPPGSSPTRSARKGRLWLTGRAIATRCSSTPSTPASRPPRGRCARSPRRRPTPRCSSRRCAGWS